MMEKGKKGMAIMIAMGPKPPRAIDSRDEDMPGMQAHRQMHEKAESPREEASEHETIPPDAVDYRTSIETCGNCRFLDEERCTRLKIGVEHGDSCKLFSAREEREPEDGEPGYR